MKKKFGLVAVAAALCAVLSLAVFTGCEKPAPEEGEKTVQIVVGDETFDVTTEADYVGAVLRELKQNEGLHLVYTESDQFGMMISEIGAFIPDSGKQEWIKVYSTIGDDMTVSIPTDSQEVGGKTYYAATVGVDSLPLRNGEAYLFQMAVGW